MGKVVVLLDGQTGSSGKGKLSGYIAKRDNIDISINNFMPNSGHTYIDDFGDKIVTTHLNTSIVNEFTKLCIGPGAAIDVEILAKEIKECNKILKNRKIYIHPRAVVITSRHVEKEKEEIRTGSTFKGCSRAVAEKIMRKNETILIKDYLKEVNKIFSNYGLEHSQKYLNITDTALIINKGIDCKKSILIEGHQGFDLDINYGLDYPYVTSRQCSASQLVADAGISPKLVDEIIMVIRPYPIRISNETNIGIEINSGDYNGSNELTWDIIRERCGATENIVELTTVTKKVRRVFEMNWERLKYAAMINRPTQIMLNFVQYINWNDYQINDYNKLSKESKDFIKKIEEETSVKVTLIGTGARNKDIIDITKR